MFYAPHPGLFPGEHSSNALGHAPKVARLTTVTTVLENLRKFSNYTLQVRIANFFLFKIAFYKYGVFMNKRNMPTRLSICTYKFI